MGQTVLVVDDETAISALIHDALTDDGYHVVEAVGEAALPLARDRHPAVILLDLMMPGLSGHEIARRLRADPATATIPLIGMSAGTNLADVPPHLFDDRLSKPFDLDDLSTAIERRSAVQERRAASALADGMTLDRPDTTKGAVLALRSGQPQR